MRISTKGRYGLRVMLELSLRHGEGPVMMDIIAACQEVSRKYLHSLLTSLRSAGLARSVRGAGGGFVLARAPSHIRVGEVIVALEGSLGPVECVEDATVCGRSHKCAARDVWCDLGKTMEKVLHEMTLRDLVDKQRAKDSHQPHMYYI